jgi:hypothetical protein
MVVPIFIWGMSSPMRARYFRGSNQSIIVFMVNTVEGAMARANAEKNAGGRGDGPEQERGGPGKPLQRRERLSD